MRVRVTLDLKVPEHMNDEIHGFFTMFDGETQEQRVGEGVAGSITKNLIGVKVEKKSADALWDPDYDQDAECECSHPYHRHFDSYDDWAYVGCKYCPCHTFRLQIGPREPDEIEEDDERAKHECCPGCGIDLGSAIDNMNFCSHCGEEL